MLNLQSFELSETLVFQVATDYKVDDNNGKDVQCTYKVVKSAYNEQVFERYFDSEFGSVEESFFAHLGVTNIQEAQDTVRDLCTSAQQNVDEM